MIREIIKEPDPRLLQVCEEAKPGPETNQLFRDMIDTIEAVELGGQYDGVAGMAAPQIGVMVRAVIVQAADKRCCVINPRIVKRSAHRVKSTEGCLSVPNKVVTIKRAWAVDIEAMSPDGAGLHITAKGEAAIAWQHEIDHLDGKLISRFEN